MLITFIQDLLRRNIEEDVREPSLNLLIPGLGTLGITYPHLIFWVQLTAIIAVQSVFNALAGFYMYYVVVKQRGSIQSTLLGYSLLPVLAISPFHIAQYLGAHNIAMAVGQFGSATVVFFRCLMAIHDTLPSHAEKNMQNCVLFYVSPVQFVFSPKTGEVIRQTKEGFRQNLFKLLQLTCIFTVMLNLLIHYDYELLPRREVKTFFDLFYWRNVLNNYAMAYLTGSALAFGTMMVGFGLECVSGITVIEVADSALTKSSSPSDFWGRRWNALVHIVLKGGVYIPLRKNGVPVGLAALGTFATSGLLHEYILTALAGIVATREGHTAYKPSYGNHLAFFAWNGVVLASEGLFHKHPFIQEVKRRLPSSVITAMVIMMVLPVGHWFTDEYSEIGFYDDFAVGMPQFTWTPLRQGA